MVSGTLHSLKSLSVDHRSDSFRLSSVCNKADRMWVKWKQLLTKGKKWRKKKREKVDIAILRLAGYALNHTVWYQKEDIVYSLQITGGQKADEVGQIDLI